VCVDGGQSTSSLTLLQLKTKKRKEKKIKKPKKVEGGIEGTTRTSMKTRSTHPGGEKSTMIFFFLPDRGSLSSKQWNHLRYAKRID
jgi:hypothetical protein